MVRKTYTVIILFVLSSISGMTQNSGFYWNNLDESSNRLQGKITGEMYYISSVGNSNYFLQKDWVNGKIELEDGDVFDNIKVRYLAFGDELIAYNDRIRALFIVDKDVVKEFSINGANQSVREFVKLYFNGPNEGARFFEKLYSGTRLLLAFHHVDEVKVSPYANKYGIMRDTEFRLNVTYYMYSQGKGFVKLLAKRRSFLKVLPDNKKAIRKIFRQNKIVFLEERAMVKAVELLDGAGILN